jgi:hypothetical protein
MSDLLEWRQRLEATHKQLLDGMTELITNKNYSEAERTLHVVDRLMLDLIGGYGGHRRQIQFMDVIYRRSLWSVTCSAPEIHQNENADYDSDNDNGY